MMYVGRYDNSSGYMEWAGRPVDSIDEAKDQVKNCMAMGVDVVQVPNGKDNEGAVVADGLLGKGWQDVNNV